MEATTIKAVRAYVRADEVARRPQLRSFGENMPEATTSWQERPIASPLAHQPGNEIRTIGGPAWIGDFVVAVEDSDGRVGIGISNGGRIGAAVVASHLAHLLIGKPVEGMSDISQIWETMWLATQFYGRKGVVVHAISAVDIALWDLLGKRFDKPVMDLLGGPVKDSLRFYATTPNAKAAEEGGFAGCKLPLPFGPSAGQAGFDANVSLFRESRETIGEDLFLAFDCWMALTVEYASNLCEALMPFSLSWLEECLLPDDYFGYRHLRKQIVPEVKLASGEHEATVAGFRMLIETGALQIAQPDPTWCGGITELLRIIDLCDQHKIPVITHGASNYGYHVAAAKPSIQLAECIIGSNNGAEVIPFYGDIFTGELIPVNGRLSIEQLSGPGFGLRLSPDVDLVEIKDSN